MKSLIRQSRCVSVWIGTVREFCRGKFRLVLADMFRRGNVSYGLGVMFRSVLVCCGVVGCVLVWQIWFVEVVLVVSGVLSCGSSWKGSLVMVVKVSKLVCVGLCSGMADEVSRCEVGCGCRGKDWQSRIVTVCRGENGKFRCGLLSFSEESLVLAWQSGLVLMRRGTEGSGMAVVDRWCEVRVLSFCQVR